MASNQNIGMNEDQEDIRKKIMSRVGKKVSFKYPGSEGDKNGVLKKRTVVDSINAQRDAHYWDVIDLIEFEGETEPWLRIGYYRKTKMHLIWGSQTTITEPISIWKKVLVGAAREQIWFRDMLESVMKELKNSPR